MLELMVVVGAVVSDVGCQRDHNEDSARLVNAGSPPEDERRGVLALVADGMGGHAAGELASQMAAEIIEKNYWSDAKDPAAALLRAVVQANHEIFTHSSRDAALEGMGTTITAVVFENWRAHLAHAGDSRLYLVRGSDIYLLTEDDSAVMEMVRMGLITREDARTHDNKNVILKALGTKAEITAQHWAEPFPVHPGDRFVLSSDGLHDVVRDEEINEAVLADKGTVACSRLVELAKQRGGPDNITVVVLSITASGTRDKRQPGDTREVKVPKG
jgi:serine/threonine protein phosphatase PrpC